MNITATRAADPKKDAARNLREISRILNEAMKKDCPMDVGAAFETAYQDHNWRSREKHFLTDLNIAIKALDWRISHG